MTVPTVDEVLADTAIGNGYHAWILEDGDMIDIHRSILKPALEAAYDCDDPDWVVCVHIEEA
jgi:hypothetical protein